MHCEYCGKFFEGKAYGGHKVYCKNRSSEYKDALFKNKSKAALGKKLSQEIKNKISVSRLAYLKEHPDKVPYVLNHKHKETYPEKYFKGLLPNYIHQYKIPETLYCADFANPSEKYIIEIDGEQHYVDENIVTHDIKRTKRLEELGWTITRIRWATYNKLSRSEKESVIESLNTHAVLDISIYEKCSNKCIDCKIEISKYSKRCVSCSAIFRNKDKLKFNPSVEELAALINEKSLVEVGRVFGVSDNSIRKRCIKLGILLIPKKS